MAGCKRTPQETMEAKRRSQSLGSKAVVRGVRKQEAKTAVSPLFHSSDRKHTRFGYHALDSRKAARTAAESRIPAQNADSSYPRCV